MPGALVLRGRREGKRSRKAPVTVQFATVASMHMHLRGQNSKSRRAKATGAPAESREIRGRRNQVQNRANNPSFRPRLLPRPAYRLRPTRRVRRSVFRCQCLRKIASAARFRRARRRGTGGRNPTLERTSSLFVLLVDESVLPGRFGAMTLAGFILSERGCCARGAGLCGGAGRSPRWCAPPNEVGERFGDLVDSVNCHRNSSRSRTQNRRRC